MDTRGPTGCCTLGLGQLAGSTGSNHEVAFWEAWACLIAAVGYDGISAMT